MKRDDVTRLTAGDGENSDLTSSLDVLARAERSGAPAGLEERLAVAALDEFAVAGRIGRSTGAPAWARYAAAAAVAMAAGWIGWLGLRPAVVGPGGGPSGPPGAVLAAALDDELLDAVFGVTAGVDLTGVTTELDVLGVEVGDAWGLLGDVYGAG
jgi:hypothetical protein